MLRRSVTAISLIALPMLGMLPFACLLMHDSHPWCAAVVRFVFSAT